MKRLRVLLIDDDNAVHAFMNAALAQEHVDFHSAFSAEEALGRVHGIAPDVILVDLVLPAMDGASLVGELRARGVQAQIILITSHASIDPAIQVLKHGALDILTKPVRVATLLDLLARTRTLAGYESTDSTPVIEPELASAHDLVGRSPEMVQVYKTIAHVAQTDATVLIQGESGTGKELIARSIHSYSKRTGPFLAVNCCAIPETLLESELFGHEKGAFTGAIGSKSGKIERADHGTFLLDEVGDMPLGLQSKMLRVLDERRLERVGGNQMRDIDVRIIAATHRDLSLRVQEGQFREDLYYRLAVVAIHVPPLRQREGDIRLLVDHYITRLAPRMGRKVTRVDPEVYDRLERYTWPGNVRELRNVLERSLVLGRGPVLEPDQLPPLHSPVEHPTLFDRLALEELPLTDVEKHYITRVLHLAGGNQCEAARRLGIHRNTLRRKLQEYHLNA